MDLFESFINSSIYWIIKPVLYIAICLSGIGTFVIPTFRNDKMIKPQRNYISGLSLYKRWDRLAFDGKLFVWCVIISIILGLLLAKLDNVENEVEAKKDAKQLKDHFDETLTNKLKAEHEKDSISNFFRDSLNKQQQTIRQQELKDSLSKNSFLVKEAQLTNEKLNIQLKNAHNENIRLQEDLNSPIIEEYLDIETGLNPLMNYDSISKKYSLWAYYKNVGKGPAKIIVARFHVFDKYLNYIDTTNNTYGDTTRILQSNLSDNRGITGRENTKYVLLEVRYRNHFGTEVKPVYLRAYQFDTSFIRKPVPLIKREIAEHLKEQYYKRYGH